MPTQSSRLTTEKRVQHTLEMRAETLGRIAALETELAELQAQIVERSKLAALGDAPYPETARAGDFARSREIPREIEELRGTLAGLDEAAETLSRRAEAEGTELALKKCVALSEQAVSLYAEQEEAFKRFRAASEGLSALAEDWAAAASGVMQAGKRVDPGSVRADAAWPLTRHLLENYLRLRNSGRSYYPLAYTLNPGHPLAHKVND